MSHMNTGGRRGTSAAFAAIFAATMITTSACGTDTGFTAKDPVTAAPAAVQRAPFPAQESHPATSADAAERRGQVPFTAPPAGRRVPD